MSVGIFSKILSKRGTVSFFFTKKKKNEQEVLSNEGRITQSPMKLRALRSSALCWNPYLARAFASRRCADVIGFPHSIILPLVHLLADPMLDLPNDYADKFMFSVLFTHG